MNHYIARQRNSDSRWDFTCGGRPVGYCAPYKEWTEEELNRFSFHADCPSLVKARGFKDKHHDNGHATEEEARDCYKQYLLDQKLSLNRMSSDSMHKCEVCREWTQHFAMMDTRLWFLCEKHNNREEVEKLFPAPQEMWIS